MAKKMTYGKTSGTKPTMAKGPKSSHTEQKHDSFSKGKGMMKGKSNCSPNMGTKGGK